MHPPRRMALRFSLLILFAFCVSSAALAQRGRLTLDGVLRDPDGHGLERIEVQLHDSGGALVNAVFTGNTGTFTFTGLRTGSYTLTVNVAGYEPVRQSQEISTTVTGVQIQLRRASESSAPGSKETDVSVRELALPPKARDAFQKGLDRLYQRHDPAGSLEEFTKVLHMAPDFYEADYQSGMALLFLGRTEQAEANFRKTISISQDRYGEPYVALATVLISTSRFQEAEQSARTGIQLLPDSWQGHYELARALLAENRPGEAEASAVQARTLNPNYADLYITLANIHIRLNQSNAVLADIDAYLQLAPDGTYSERAKQIKATLEKKP
jgi:Flp pilus assembly protein TadD